ncbi:MAG: hypothetical protein RBS16_08895 [Candidatus Cloacimonadales bacterium]|jgi:hypothetical protein|nr:hypothetical protein [Candidatus Cloacimonadales bacterium]
MKVYLSGMHKFPKRIDDYILAYYANNNVVILRKPVKRSILPQNIKIKNNQPYLCALWGEMSLNIKSLFADYAKVYKINTQQKRSQGVSAFSMFIYFIYRLQARYQISIRTMTIDFIMSIFSQFNSIKKLMRESLLFCLSMRFYSQNKKLVESAQLIEDKRNIVYKHDKEEVLSNKDEELMQKEKANKIGNLKQGLLAPNEYG